MRKYRVKIATLTVIVGALLVGAFNACSRFETHEVFVESKKLITQIIYDYHPDDTPSPLSNHRFLRWPNFFGSSGTYAVTVSTDEHVAEMASLDMRLHIATEPMATSDEEISSLRVLMKKNGAKLLLDLDHIIWSTEICPRRPEYCEPLTQEIERTLLKNVQDYLAKLKDDPTVVGFWVLDDYPGIQAPGLLEKVRELVEESNRAYSVNRKTVCGFSPNLDIDGNSVPSDEVMYTNFTPKGCDFVAFYPYARTSDGSVTADRFDWSMSSSMPLALDALKALGWDPAEQPLIGMPQAFGYPPNYAQPTAQNLSEQISSFCEMGALSILAFIWHIDDPRYPYITPSKDDSLKEGYISGLKNCQAMWNSEKMSVLSPLITSTVFDL